MDCDKNVLNTNHIEAIYILRTKTKLLFLDQYLICKKSISNIRVTEQESILSVISKRVVRILCRHYSLRVKREVSSLGGYAKA